MKRLFMVAGAIALAAMLSACATSLPNVGEPADSAADTAEAGFFDRLGEFTRNDLEVAMQLTGDRDLDGQVDPDVANGDPVALLCYTYLHGKVTAAQAGEGMITVAGAVSAFQSARNVKRRIDNGISDEFHLACGPLRSEVRATALGVVGRVASGGILPF